MKRIYTPLLTFFLILSLIKPFPTDAAMNPEHSEVLYSTSAGGRGYTEARKIPSVAPGIALGLATITLIVALGLYKQGNVHSHSH